MEIVWDERKRLANIEKHALHFADLTLEFFQAALIRKAKLGRLQAIGRLADSEVSVIFATLGAEGLSVSSMRPARLQERRLIG